MSQEDHSELVNELMGICHVDENTARAYLEAFNWDLSVCMDSLIFQAYLYAFFD